MTEIRKLKRAVVKEELVALTGKVDHAIVLNQFIYWSERVKDVDQYLKEETERIRSFSDGSVENESDIKQNLLNGWIYKTAAEMKEECMFEKSETTMERIFKSLVDNQWLDRRNNPKYKWDKTYQYRVNILKVQNDLHKLGYTLEGYSLGNEGTNLQNEGSELQNEESEEIRFADAESNLQNEDSKNQNEGSSLQNEGAIPEITSSLRNKDNIDTYKDTDNNPISNKNNDKNFFPSEREREQDEIFKQSLANDVPPETHRTLSILSFDFDEMYNWVGIILRAKKKVEEKYNLLLYLENIDTELNKIIIPAIRTVKKKNDIDNQDNYLFTSIFNGLQKIAMEIVREDN